MKSVDTTDIANMILLAEGVLIESFGSFMYDENGVRLHGDKISEQFKKDAAEGIEILVLSIIGDENITLSDAIWTTPEELMEKLSPIKRRIIGMFRNGVNCDAEYDKMCADPSVPDDWLFALFAMRVRDRMISASIVRSHDKKKENQTSE